MTRATAAQNRQEGTSRDTSALQVPPATRRASEALTVVLPYPPSTNTAYAVVRGRKVKTKAARQYATSVQQILQTNTEARAFKKALPRTARLSVTYEVNPPDRRRRDIANVEKLVTDAAFKWFGIDDSQIDHLTLTRSQVMRPKGQLTATIATLEEVV